MNLPRLRRRKKLTQKQLANAIGVSRALIAQVESGWRKPYPKLKREIAKALNEPVEKIFK